MKGKRSPYQHSVARSTRRLELKQYRDDPRRRKVHRRVTVFSVVKMVAIDRADRAQFGMCADVPSVVLVRRTFPQVEGAPVLRDHLGSDLAWQQQ